MKKYPQSRIYLTVILAIFLLAGFGVFAVGNSALADRCPKDSKGNPTCPTESNIRLQVGIPGLSGSCTYTAVSYPDGKRKEEPKTMYCVSGFPHYVTSIYQLFIGVVGILAVIMIMLGGFQWLLAAGNAQKISGAKTTIISAVMGLVLALGSYAILNFLNPRIWDLKLNISNVSLTDVSVKGLCTKEMNPILRDDKDKGPQCGKTYILMAPDEKTGQDVKCSGYLAGNHACVTFDGSTYSKVNSISINDQRSDGFGNMNYSPHISNKCGKLIMIAECSTKLTMAGDCITKLAPGYYYGTQCAKDKDETCVLDLKDGADFSKTRAILENLIKRGQEEEIGYIRNWEKACNSNKGWQ